MEKPDGWFGLWLDPRDAGAWGAWGDTADDVVGPVWGARAIPEAPRTVLDTDKRTTFRLDIPRDRQQWSSYDDAGVYDRKQFGAWVNKSLPRLATLVYEFPEGEVVSYVEFHGTLTRKVSRVLRAIHRGGYVYIVGFMTRPYGLHDPRMPEPFRGMTPDEWRESVRMIRGLLETQARRRKPVPFTVANRAAHAECVGEARYRLAFLRVNDDTGVASVPLGAFPRDL